MTQFSKKQLQEKAAAAFKTIKGSVIYATSDGQLFTNKNRAELHAGSGKNKLGVYDFARADVQEQTASTEENKTENKLPGLKELSAELQKIDSVEELEKIREIEKNGENRKGAFKFIDDRLEELKQATETTEQKDVKNIDVNAETVTGENNENDTKKEA